MGGLAIGATVALPDTADAAQCVPLTLTTGCYINGSVSLTGGFLYMIPPVALNWTASITAQPQSVVDSTITDTGCATPIAYAT